MSRIMLMAACLASSSFALSATANEPAPKQPKTEEQWLVELRNSASYKKGLEAMHGNVDFAYDQGAVRGAKHWETVHRYYLDLATANGCKDGMRLAEGPVRSCQNVPSLAPALGGAPYEEGKKEVMNLAREALRPARAQSVLLSIFDYGYIQGMRHGLRVHNDDLEWKQAYYQACVTRANDAAAEPTCSEKAKAWSAAVLERIKKQLDHFGTAESENSK
jgi:hypothetical protein